MLPQPLSNRGHKSRNGVHVPCRCVQPVSLAFDVLQQRAFVKLMHSAAKNRVKNQRQQPFADMEAPEQARGDSRG